MASGVFATLRPVNPQAKIAFHNGYRAILLDSDDAHSKNYMVVGNETEYDGAVRRYKLANAAKALMKEGSDDDDSAGDTEADTDIEEPRKPLGMIWKGLYIFDLNRAPADPEVGWTVGQGGGERATDFLMMANIKARQALFNFNKDTGYIVIRSLAEDGVMVDEKKVDRGRHHALRNSKADIKLGDAIFRFAYAPAAQGINYATFDKQRSKYLQRYLKLPALCFPSTPTPVGPPKVVGQWTFDQQLGQGAFGKVHMATNESSERAALKFVRDHPLARKEIRVLEQLKELCEDASEPGRILRFVEMHSMGSQKLALILQPAVSGTFQKFVDEAAAKLAKSNGSCVIITQEVCSLVEEVLEGVKWLHLHGWVHRDLKPLNIGFIKGRAVILDCGGAIQVPNKELMITPTPGMTGTINYISPERDLRRYDSETDIWALGIILFELSFGYHPLEFDCNPWSPGASLEMVSKFQRKYRMAMAELNRNKKHHLLVAELIQLMLRFDDADDYNQRAERITAEDALEHPFWWDQPAPKRMR